MDQRRGTRSSTTPKTASSTASSTAGDVAPAGATEGPREAQPTGGAPDFWTRFGRKEVGGVPKYIFLRDRILTAIREGFWQKGDRLPPEKELALATGLSLGTVQKAYGELAQDGTIERRQGRAGSVVSRQPRSVDTVWHFLFSDDRHERFFSVFPRVDRVHRHRDRGSWSLHLHWVEDEVVQIDRVVDIGQEFLVFSQFFIDARIYDQARRGKSEPLEGINLRRELNLNVQGLCYDMRLERLPREVCGKIGVKAGTLGMVVEVRMTASPQQQGYFQRIFIPETRFWLRIDAQPFPRGG